MRRTICTIGCAMLAFALVVFSVQPAASAVTTSIPPTAVYEETVSADNGDSITYSWNADGDVRFVLRGPGGSILADVIDTSGFDIFDISQGGTYRFTWENLEPTFISLNYNIDVLPFSGLEGVLDIAAWVFWGIIIGAIVFAAIIIILFVFLLRGDKPRAPYQVYGPPPQQPYGWPQYQYAPPAPARPPAPILCPTCSELIDPQSASCPKCGTKLR